jgi:RHS repeat-associated protein
MLESAPGTPDLYDFAARSYNPALGTFTSLDSHLGSAQNTALLNGYLYANANPATLVDPDGHCSMYDNMRASSTCGTNAADIQSAGEAAGLTGSGDMSRDVYNSQPHFSGSGDMGKDVYKAQQVKSDPQFIGSGDMSTDINNWRENQQLAASWAASSHNDMGSAAYTAMTHKQYGVATNDASARNIAAEDNYTFYSGLCQHGDQSACATMQTIPVNATDARPVGDAIQEGTKDEAEKLIKDLPDGPAKTWLGRLLKVSSGLIKAVNIIEMINDAWAAYDTGGAGAASKVILMDTYKLDVAVGAMAACGGPEDGVGIVCGIAGAWVGDQTAGVVGWGIDQLAGWGPKW